MQRAAMLPVSGPADDHVLAAGGGLEVPGRDPDASAQLAPAVHDTHPPEPIPGARETDALTHRESGAVSGRFNGADIPAAPPGWVGDDLARERAVEGGGPAKSRPHGFSGTDRRPETGDRRQETGGRGRRATSAAIMGGVETIRPRQGLSPDAVHALSNQLAVILGFIELVVAETGEDDPRRSDLLEIQAAAHECARIVAGPQ